MPDTPPDDATEADAGKRILPLSPDAISQIYSSKQITTLSDVVLALLENSLDAGATEVKVELCFQRGDCVVEDNGHGIKLLEFSEMGGLGKMHCSSKRTSGRSGTDTMHGYSGAFLASLAALSVLTVTSLTAHSEHVGTMMLHRGKVMNSRVLQADNATLPRIAGPHGTAVRVQDLFGNMPVRVKQRALATDGNTGHEKAWRALKRGIVALLVAWPKICVVKVRDVGSRPASLAMCVGTSSYLPMLTETNVRHLRSKASKMLSNAPSILYQAGMASQGTHDRWVPIAADTASVSVKGHICLQPAATRQAQFLSIGVQPCENVEYNHLYEAINQTFANSSFGIVERKHSLEMCDNMRTFDASTRKQMPTKKSADRWPMFVLQINLGNNMGANEISGAKHNQTIIRSIIIMLEAMSARWLTKYNFSPRARHRKRSQATDSTLGNALLPQAALAGLFQSTDPDSLQEPLANMKRKGNGTTRVSNATKRRKNPDAFSNDNLLAVTSHFPLDKSFESERRPSTISHIRSAKSGAEWSTWQGKKPSTAPATNCSSMMLELPNRVEAKFSIPTVEAGEYSHVDMRRKEQSTHKSSLNNSLESFESSTHQNASSEFFNGIDDEELLAIEDTACCTNATVSGQSAGTKPAVDSTVHWTDPTSRQVFSVNSRTGAVLPFDFKETRISNTQVPEAVPRKAAAINTAKTASGLPLRLSKRLQSAQSVNQEHTSWLSGFLKEWENPIFVQQNEERIPTALSHALHVESLGVGRACGGLDNAQDYTALAESCISRVTKAGLKVASIIKQVDEKFILCLMPSGLVNHSTSVVEDILVLVDQHAASERVILEGLFRDLCIPMDQSSATARFSTNTDCVSAVNTTLLTQPLRYRLDSAEFELFNTHARHFATWGILYDALKRGSDESAASRHTLTDDFYIAIRALPPGILERCKQAPDLLIELLRSEIWSIADGQVQTRTAGRRINHDMSTEQEPIRDGRDETADQAWVKTIGDCPKGIVEMLNSRACRSAIMFNDPLTTTQCQELIRELSQCAFPFICAHGRCSMVPLIQLGGDSQVKWAGVESLNVCGFDETGGTSKQNFTEAFRAWKGLHTQSSVDVPSK